ncbi:MAG TPA: peptidylprolyl isomerase [Pirellulales bacterium]|nr:peptidylprolyl isomerase [Pirellulales bacterium]
MRFHVSLVLLAMGLTMAPVASERLLAQAARSNTKDPQAYFDQQFAEWKKIVAEMRKTALEYRAAKLAGNTEDAEKLQKKYEDIKGRGLAMEPKMHKAAELAYLAAPNKNKEIGQYLEAMASTAEQREQYEEAVRLANVLIDNGYENKAIYAIAGRAAFNANDFETAAKDLKIAKDANVLEDSPGKVLLAQVPEYQKRWDKEVKIREAEAKADDLPRVKLTTTKGDIVLELFENEAPNTVANFITLVEKGFYNGTPFHRVLKGFVAQGGDPDGTGKGGPGYTIACECDKPNHREHFRGSLSMAHAGKDTGGSQFFLTFVPTPHLDGRHTVFGRIIEGMDVLAQLQRRDPSSTAQQPDPDKVLEGTVIRKRDHKYKPVTLAGKKQP